MKDVANKIPLPGHQGPHPQKYHAEIFRRLREVTNRCGTNTQQCRQAFLDELEKMKLELNDESSQLRKLLDGVPLTE